MLNSTHRLYRVNADFVAPARSARWAVLACAVLVVAGTGQTPAPAAEGDASTSNLVVAAGLDRVVVLGGKTYLSGKVQSLKGASKIRRWNGARNPAPGT
jgi:hypothetical protein